MLALLLARQVDVVVRQHQCRQTDFRLGRRLGKEDHVVLWQRPQRPEWMDEETYAVIPPTLEVRELKVRVEIRGFRVEQLVVVTTLTDAQRYPKSEIARLFRQRWPPHSSASSPGMKQEIVPTAWSRGRSNAAPNLTPS